MVMLPSRAAGVVMAHIYTQTQQHTGAGETPHRHHDRPARHWAATARAAAALLAAFAALLALPLQAQEQLVPSNWSLKPSSLTTGDKFRLLFLSSTKRDGSATAIATYNTFVQTRAAAGHTDIQAYSAGFKVVGCTADVDAIDNTGTTGTGVPIYWLNGNKVADDYDDFYDADWDEEANDKNELGANGPDTSESSNYPLTGCEDYGEGAFNILGTSSLALGEDDVRVGRPNSSATNLGPLSGDSVTDKTNNHPMYGLSEVFEVDAAVATNTAVPSNWSLKPSSLTTGDKFRLLFLSSTKRDGSATAIATYNTFVQTRAAAGHTDIKAYSDGFNAVGCTADVDAIDNTGTTGTGVPIYWLNGNKVADDYDDFYDEDWDEEANDKNELGANGPDTSESSNYPLTGCEHYGEGAFNTLGTSSLALGEDDVRVGRPNSSAANRGPLSSDSVTDKTNNHPMYGLSEVFEVDAAVVTNSAPTFDSSTAARSVAENTAAGQNVGAVLTADDTDGDTLTYTLEGTDAASFDLVTTADPAAQIRTKTGVTYNHEAKSTYTVVVKADDGNGGTDTVTVTITVTDVDEAPAQPAAPSVSTTAGSTTSLDVSWTAPVNTGPDIDSYDLQYREGTSGGFTNGPQNVTGTSAAIGSLDAATAYQVQVRATNAEGDSDWSPSGTGTTGTPSNNPPTFDSSTAARSVAENTAAGQNVGAVLTATDDDGDTLTYTLEGTDAASFDLVTTTDPAAQIRTKTGVTYNHEAQSTYTVFVKADDGNSGTDSVTVTITVTDVDEAPAQPAAPSVSPTAGSTTSLDVSWTAPANTGPDIDNYDLRYRQGTSGSFTNGPQDVTGTSAAIGSLDAATAYQVQVRATSAEGNSDWSTSGSGTTSPNNPPTFTSSTAARSVAENTDAGQNVGAVLTATDDDGDTLTYTLEGTDAASFDLDTTTTAGSARIRTKAGVTYNHEAKSTYTVVLKADDTEGGTDTVTVTITVTDVDEPPGQPAAPSVSATSGPTTSLDVGWTAPTNTGPDIDNYDLRYQKTTESNWTNGPQDQTGTSATIGSLDAATAYQVQVRATNAEGDGNWSTSGSGTTGTPINDPLTVNGNELVIRFNAVLNTNKVPDPGDFSVTVNAVSRSVTTVEILNERVRLTLSSPVQPSQVVILSYTPGSTPLEDDQGTQMEAISNQTVTNNTLPDVSIAPASATEGDSIEFTVTITPGPAVQTDVFYFTASETATEGVDFEDISGLLTFNPGETEKTVTVTTIEDEIDEGSETFILSVTDPFRNQGLLITGTILDNDEPLVQAVPVDWSLVPSGLLPGDSFRLLFLASSGTRAQSQSIGFYDNHTRDVVTSLGHADIVSYAEHFRVLGSTVAVDARDHTATSASGGVPIYWLGGDKVADDYADFYDGAWDSNVPRSESGDTVSSATAFTGTNSDGTKAASLYLGPPGGQVQVGDPETSGQELNSGTSQKNAQLGTYGLSGLFGFLPGQLPELTVSDESVGEGDVVEFTVTLSATIPFLVSFQYQTASGTATEGEDFEAVSGKFTIAAGETEGIIEIATIQDPRYDGTETFSLVLSGALNAVLPGGLSTLEATATIEDDETLPSLAMATVDGVTLALTFSGPLEVLSVPVSGDFSISVDGADRPVRNVVVSGATVTLILESPVTNGQSVSASYMPGLRPLLSSGGGGELGVFTDQPVANSTPTAPPSGTDRALLVELFNVTGGPNWLNSENWRTDLPLNGWYGVRTDSDGRVTSLDLSENGLYGIVPADLIGLAQLKEFSVVSNEACVPGDPAVSDWLGAIDFDGAFCPSEESVIDIAVFYTPAAKANKGSKSLMETYVESLVAGANSIFADSGVGARLSAVLVEEVEYSEPAGDKMFAHLTRFQDPDDGYMDEVHTRREAVGADLIQLITAPPAVASAGGVATLLRKVSPKSSNRIYSATADTGDSALFVHEIGHVMGLNHDRFSTCTGDTCGRAAYPYGYGYVNQRGFEPGAQDRTRWFTVMAYGNQCRDNFELCTPVFRFSDPSKDFRGHPLGIPGDVWTASLTGPADAVRALNNSRETIARYRGGVRQYIGPDGERYVDSNWPLIPTGLRVGDAFRLLFVTSGTDMAGDPAVAVYDSGVQGTVAGGHASITSYSLHFRALVSTEDVDARDHTGTTGSSGVPIYWLGGEKVADDYSDFYDGSWDSNVPRNEHGIENPVDETFTGSNSDGTKYPDRYMGQGQVRVGNPTSSGEELDGGMHRPQAQSKSLYGLSGVFVVTRDPSRVNRVTLAPAPNPIGEGTDSTYAIGDVVQATVTFAAAVEVTGTPQLELDIGGQARQASYASGGGTAALVFAYTVAVGDEDTDGVSIGASKLALNGGTIEAGGVAAALAHPALAASTSHKVDGVQPTLDGATVTGSSLELAYSETLDTGSEPAPAAFAVTVAGTPRNVTTVTLGGSKVALTLASAVTAGETVAVSYTKPGTNPLRDLAGNQADSFSGRPAGRGTTVSTVALTSSAGSDSTYAIGDTVQATVTFAAAVEVTGTPRLELDIGGQPRQADYASGGGTAALVFAYTVAVGDEDTDGIAIGASKLALNGGAIKAGGVAAALAHPALAASTSHKVDGVRPTLEGATVTGSSLELAYSETLDAGSQPATSAFAVTVESTARMVSSVAVSGSAVTLTLASAVTAGEAVAVSYTKPGTDPLRDLAGNEADSFSGQAAGSGTTVSTVALTSSAGPDSTYAIGDTVQATVTFAAAVEVTGTPQLEVDIGGQPRQASYASGGGTAALVFAYTVAVGDEDTDGVSIGASKLALNGGAIEAGGVAAALAHLVLAANTSHKVDGVRPMLEGATVTGSSLEMAYSETLDTGSQPAPAAFVVTVTGTARNVTAVTLSGSKVILTLASAVTAGEAVAVSYTKPQASPLQDLAGNQADSFSEWAAGSGTTVSTVALTSSAGPDSTYAIGDTVQATVTFAAAVEVTGTPRLELDIGGQPRQADYASGGGTAALVFAYTVAVGDEDTDGVSIGASKLALNGGAIKAGGVAAALAHPALAASTSHKVDGVRPTLEGATVTGSSLELAYSETLDAGSQPATSAFAVTVESTARMVSSVAVSGSAVTLTLASAVTAGEAVAVSYTKPGTDPLRDLAGNEADSFSGQAAGSGTTVSTVALTSSAGPDSTYAIGDTVQATVTFAAAVEVTGTPQLEVDIGGQARQASYASGGGTAALVFAYTVAVGDEDTDGVSIGASKLALNGGAIEAGGVAAVLTHLVLAANTSHKVDGVRPTLEGATVTGSSLEMAYSETLDTGSQPAPAAFVVTVTGTARNVTAVTLSGSKVILTLASAVTAGEAVAVSYTKPQASPLQDLAGNQADSFSGRAAGSGTTVSTVALTSSAGTDSTYAIGDVVQATVTFAAAVEVTGTPQLELDIGGQARQASYASGGGTAALVFAYTVAVGDEDTDGVSIGASKLALNGGTIEAGGVAAALAHPLLAASTSHKVDGVRPTLDGATVTGSSLELAYSETLDTGSEPAPAAFAVTVAGADRNVTAVTLSGSTVALTLASAVTAGEAVAVSYTKPQASPLRDLAGNEADSFSGQAAGSGTTVSTVALTSSAGPDSTYAIGDTVQATVTFAAAVEVTGTPRLELDIGGQPRQADYASGGGTAALVFAYTVAVGDEDTDGIAIGASKLALNGGAIEAGGVAAALAHPALAASTSHKVDGVRPTLEGATVTGSSLELAYSETLDAGSQPATSAFAVTVESTARMVSSVAVSGSAVTLTLASAVTAGEAVAVSYTKPGTDPLRDLAGNEADSFSGQAAGSGTTVSTVALTSSAGPDSTYAIGDTVQATVTFAAAVEVTGTPQLEVDIGGQPRQASYASGSGTAALVFAYTVAVGDEDTDGVSIGASKLALNGGAIEAGGVAAALTHLVLAANTSHKVDGVRPMLEGATVTGSSLEMAYSETLDTGSQPAPAAFVVRVTGTARNVTAVTLSGSKVTLTLASAVTAGEAVAVSYTKPQASPLQDLAGNQADSFSGRAAGSGTTVSTVALTSSAGTDSTYAIGDVVQATVTFAAAVEVTGTPQLELDIGGQARQASYASGGGTAALVFAYTVAVGDEDTDGVSIGASKLALNGGAIEAGGVAAALAHPLLAASTSHKVDGVRPTLDGATVTGSSLELMYSEAVDTGSEPAPAAFAVTVAGTPRNVTAVALSGSTVALTLASAVTAGEAVAVSYTKPQASPLQDLAGNQADSFSGQAAGSGTMVSTVALTSSAGPDSTYAIGDVVQATVTFAAAVEVTGTPQLELDIGGQARQASYASGGGTAALVFAYTVAVGDEDTDGIAIGASKLALNGGAIEAGGVAAALAHPVLAANTSHGVDGVRPTLDGATVTGSSLELMYSEAVDTGSEPAPAAFAVTVAGTARNVTAVALSGSKVTLTLASAVMAGEAVAVSYTKPQASPLQDLAGNEADSFSGQAAGSGTTVSTVALTSSAGPDSTYAIGDVVQATVTFAAAVEVTGPPQLELDIGGQPRQASYASGGGTAALVFAYTVAAGDEDTDGVSISASKLALNGGAIKAGAVAAALAHPAVATNASHKVDGVRPTLEGATATGSSLELMYSEAVDTGSEPAPAAFAVTVAGTPRNVTAVALSGSRVSLTLASAVTAGEAVAVSYTKPQASPLQDLAGNQADSFSGQAAGSGTMVSTVALTSSAGPDSTYAIGDVVQVTVTFAAAVEVTGAPRLELDIGGQPRQASYASGGGTAALVFAYTVAVGDEDTDGIAIGASKLALNGGAIEAGAVAAALTHPVLAANASHKVDGVRPTLEGATATGSSLELMYSEALDTGSEPAPAAFTVTVAGAPRNVTAVALSDSKVTLTLASAVTAGETVAVSYTKPGTDPLRDLAGNQADSFSGRPAGSGTTVSTMALTSGAGPDSTYAIGDTVQATVTFAAAVEVTGTPQLEVDIGGQPRQASYASGSGTAALVFAYTVAVGDEDTDGVSIGASKLALNGGAIEAGGVAAALTHLVLAANTSHKVDGVRPMLEGATVTGSSLEMAYSETLDTGSQPAPAAFVVRVTGTARNVTAVTLSGSKVTLTLASAVTAGEAVAVSYTKPQASPLQDLAGNQADSFSGRAAGSGTTVSTVALTSSAGTDSTYAIGDVVQATVTFAAAVEVTGTPQLELDIGGQARQASYASGGGTAALVFAYTVAVGDEDTDGVSIGASKLALNGGAIEAGGVAAALAHPLLAASTSHKVDGVRPTLDGATVTGSSLELMYSEAVDTGSEPAPAAFAVTVAGTPRNVTAVALSGSRVSLTLASAVMAGEAVAVSYTKPQASPLQDLAGNQADSFSGQAAGSGTMVSTVALTSSAGPDSTYAIGDVVQATVTFAAAVEVTGTPQLELDIGGQPRQAYYASGGGTAALVFAYTVAVGDEDTDGIAIGASKLALNGGAIKAGGVAAALAHPALAASTSHKVDGVRPTLEGATATGSSLELVYSEALDTGSEPAPAAFAVTVAGAARNVTAVALSGSKVTLTLASAVTAGETVAVSYSKPQASPLRDLAGNQADSFSGQAAGSGTTVSAVALTSSAGTDSTYAIGDVVQATVTFAAAVEVTGTPQLELDIGGQPRQADYASGGGTAALVFAYTVAVGDEDTDGIAIGASKLALNGGAIEAGGVAAALAHPVLAASTSHKVDGVRPTLEGATATGNSLELVYSEALNTGSEPAPAAFAVTVAGADRNVTAVTLSGSTVALTLASAVTAGEAVAVSYTKPQASPLRDLAGNEADSFSGQAAGSGTTVSAVALTSSAGSDSTYAIGDTVQATVTFAAAVEVTGTPQLELDIGGQARQASYASGGGTAALVFAYTVAVGDEDTDGIAIGASKLALNGGAIEAGGVAAALAHPVLATNASHKVDGVRPTLEGATATGSSLELMYSEAVDTGSEPAPAAFAVTVAGTPRNVTAVALSGSRVSLTLASAVTAGEAVAVSYTKPQASPLQDLAGNQADSFSGQAAGSGTTVSTVALTSSAGPDSTYAIGDVVQATVTFAAAVEVTGTPQLELDIGGQPRQASYASGGGTAALVFAYTVAAGDEDTDGVSISASKLALNGGAIEAGAVAAALAHPAVAASTSHKVDGVRPTLEGATATGSLLELMYSEALDTGSQPAPTAFVATVAGTPRNVTAVALSGSTVTLTLASAVTAGEAVAVSYTKPQASPLRDLAGNEAGSFGGQAVGSGTTVSTVALTSSAGPDSTYAISDVVQARVTFAAAVEVTGAPQLELDIGGQPRQASYASGGGTAALVFAYTVAVGDEDTDGIAIGASKLALNGGAIEAGAVAAALVHPALAANASHKVDGVRPTLEGATATGSSLELMYSEALDTGSEPAPTAFAVTVESTARMVSSVALSGSKVTLTLASAVTAGEAVAVSYTKPQAGPLQDLAGNQADSFSGRAAGSGTTVSTMALTSGAGSDMTYAIGDVVQVTVTFAAAVEVTGAPRLELDIGGQPRQASYASGGGTAALVFAYTVAVGDEDTDGIAIGASKLALNGGAIEAGVLAAALTHPALVANASHKVDGVRPTLEGATATGSSLELVYSEALDTGSEPAPAAFAVTVAGTPGNVTTVTLGGSKVTLTLASAVTAGEAVAVSYTKPGTDPLRDLAGNQADSFSGRAAGTGTTVSTVALTSSTGTDSTYAIGDTVQAAVTFAAAVEVTGTPQLELDVGGQPRQANYAGGGGTAALVFAYTVAVGDEDTDGIAIGASKLALNGGAIEAGGVAAALTHPVLAANASHKVDGVRPTLEGATATGSSLELMYSEALDTGSEPAPAAFTVTVAGTPRNVTAVALSGSKVTLTLASAVTAGETVAVSYTKPGTDPLRDLAGNQADSFSGRPAGSGTTVSTMALTSGAGSDMTYAIGDVVQVTVTFAAAVEVTGAPRLELDIGGQPRQASYASGGGTAALVFAYTVAVGDEDTDGIAIGASKLALNGGAIEAGAVAAALTHPALVANASHKVDGVRPTLEGATATGSSLELVYSEALDTGSEPAPAAFAVTVAGTPGNVTTVTLGGSKVALTLASAVTAGEAVAVSYTKPQASPLRDLAGNQADSFSGQAAGSGTTVSTVALIQRGPGLDLCDQRHGAGDGDVRGGGGGNRRAAAGAGRRRAAAAGELRQRRWHGCAGVRLHGGGGR